MARERRKWGARKEEAPGGENVRWGGNGRTERGRGIIEQFETGKREGAREKRGN